MISNPADQIMDDALAELRALPEATCTQVSIVLRKALKSLQEQCAEDIESLQRNARKGFEYCMELIEQQDLHVDALNNILIGVMGGDEGLLYSMESSEKEEKVRRLIQWMIAHGAKDRMFAHESASSFNYFVNYLGVYDEDEMLLHGVSDCILEHVSRGLMRVDLAVVSLHATFKSMKGAESYSQLLAAHPDFLKNLAGWSVQFSDPPSDNSSLIATETDSEAFNVVALPVNPDLTHDPGIELKAYKCFRDIWRLLVSAVPQGFHFGDHVLVEPYEDLDAPAMVAFRICGDPKKSIVCFGDRVDHWMFWDDILKVLEEQNPGAATYKAHKDFLKKIQRIFIDPPAASAKPGLHNT